MKDFEKEQVLQLLEEMLKELLNLREQMEKDSIDAEKWRNRMAKDVPTFP